MIMTMSFPTAPSFRSISEILAKLLRSIFEILAKFQRPKWQSLRCRITSKRFQEYEKFIAKSRLGLPVSYEYREGWFVTLATPEGEVEAEVYETLYDTLKPGDRIHAKLRITRDGTLEARIPR